MNTFSKKLISTALAATTTVWASGALLLFPVAVNAQTTSDLQAQIAALLSQIQQLQAQLGGSSSASFTFTRNLTVGSTGNDVQALQQFLNSHGAQVSATGAGSPGNETTYFGQKTKTALAAYQASVGISPAIGYFGPITRTRVNGLAGGQPPAPGQPPVIAPATGLSVSLASDNPAPGSLISSSASAAARTPVLAVNLTAGNASGVTVSGIKFNKLGVLSDSSISGAYLVENGKVIAQYNSLSAGVIDFSGLAINVAAGQTRKVWFAIDVATALSAGNTVGFGISSASNVTAWDATNALVAAAGNFPLNGNTFTVTSVSSPNLAILTITSSSIGTSVTAGTNNNLVGAWNFSAANSRVKLTSINFRVIGSATKTDIRNVKLLVNGTQVGNTLASVDAGGNAYFDMTSAPGTLNTGSNNIQIYADVMGSPNFNFQFEILNSYDVYAVDSQYNVPISGSSNTGTQISILAGTITVSQATNTPTGNIAPGQSGVTLAKFTIYAAGEPVRVRWLGVGMNITGATTSIDNLFGNLSLIDDAGGQIGSTVSTLSTTSTCTDVAGSTATGTFRTCFGSSGSPINYTVPANTTRVLSLIVDVKSTASFTSVVGVLTGNTSNLQGQTSASTASSAAVQGSALTLSASSLALARNSALGTQTIAAGGSGIKISSYAFTASSAEGVRVNNLSVQANGSGTVWTNLKVMVSSAQFGTTQGSVASGTVYSFSGSPFTVPAGQTTYVDIYADSITGSGGTISPATIITGCSASGLTSFNSIGCTSTNGQAITFAGQSTLTVSADQGQPQDQLVMGTTGATLGKFRLAASNSEDIKVSSLYIFQGVGANTAGSGPLTLSSFGNVAMYLDGGALLATAGAANTSGNATGTPPGSTSTVSSNTGYYYQFNFATPVVVPQGGSIVLALKGDVNSYASSGASDNATHVFKIATSTDTALDTAIEAVVATGRTSNATSAIVFVNGTTTTNNVPVGPVKTVLRTKLSFTAASSGSALERGGTPTIGTLSFTADSAGAATLNSVTINFSGLAASATSFLDGVTLVDASNPGTNLGTNNVSSSIGSCAANSGCFKSFLLGATTNGLVVSAGQTKTLILKYTGANLQAAIANVAQSLSAYVNARTDIVYTDGIDSAATSGITLPSTQSVPVTIGTHTGTIGG